MNLGNWLRLAWDRAAAVALIAAGAVALILGWVGVSGEAFPAKQLPYLISGGIAGVFILGVGTMCWLSAALRGEGRGGGGVFLFRRTGRRRRSAGLRQPGPDRLARRPRRRDRLGRPRPAD